MEPPLTTTDSAPPTDEGTTHRRDTAVAWLMSRINYERVAVIPYNERQLKLDRMRQLLTRLGSPDAGLRIIHIAGTKGKGSTAALLASMLTTAGLRTGVYSSPHVERIEERWAIDGQPLEAEELASLVAQLRPAVEAMDQETDDDQTIGPPTFFDITTAMALLHFANRQCDAVLMEVGLGGRLDSTNVCLPVVSVITSISLDHTKQLGDTLTEIAAEKGGIIKPGVPVVSGVMQAEPQGVLAAQARDNGCRLIQRGTDFDTEDNAGLSFWREGPAARDTLDNLTLGLLGRHQHDNAAVALAVVGELRDQGWPLSTDACRVGLKSARLPARVERFAGPPTVIVDAAHNGASAAALVDAVNEMAIDGPRTLVVAISRDKDLPAITQALAPAFDRVIATQFVDNPRAVEPQQLAQMFAELHQASSTNERDQVAVAADPADAWQMALDHTPDDGLIVVTGSFFIAAELRPLVAAHSALRRS